MSVFSEKIMNYNDLSALNESVSVNIDKLLVIINQINQKCNNLVSSGIWEGSAANAFSNISNRVASYSEAIIDNFKVVNDGKKVAVDKFISTESNNASRYF